MHLCMWRRIQNKETGGGTWRVPALLPVLRQKFPRYFGGCLEFSATSLSYYLFWYFDVRTVLMSQDDTPPSTPSSLHILPVYCTRNTNISPSHIIQINLSDFLDITYIVFYINSLQTVRTVHAPTKQQLPHFINILYISSHNNPLLLVSYNFSNFNTF